MIHTTLKTYEDSMTQTLANDFFLRRFRTPWLRIHMRFHMNTYEGVGTSRGFGFFSIFSPYVVTFSEQFYF